jgi:hypothetical protein
VLNGETEADFSGRSVSAAGDVNGDGYDDLLIGAHGRDYGTGASYVVFGKASGFTANLNLSALSGTNGLELNGETMGDRSGFSVSAAGDVNGDGYDDMLIGAEQANLQGSNPGAAYVVFGRDFRGEVDFLGGSGNDAFIGTAAAESFVAGDGDDTLTGGGGADVFRGGADDDRIVVPDAAFFDVDGGSGADTLALAGGGITLDLTAIANTKITGIEVIDLTGSGDNTLTLTASDLFDLSDSTNTLRVDGNTNDVVNAGSGWTDLGTGVNPGYRTWTQGLATLIVDADITQNIS